MRIFLAMIVIAVAFVPRIANASCAGPSFEIDRNTAPPGAMIHVSGEAFSDGCDDVGGSDGCGRPIAEEEVLPMRDVRFELRHRGTTVDAAVADAEADGQISATLTVPIGAKPGRYTVASEFWGATQQTVLIRVTPDR